MTLFVRPLQLSDDLEAIHQLTLQLGYPTSIENIQRRWQHIHQNPLCHTLVIENQHRVIGYTGFIEQYSWEFDDGFIRVQAFVIDEAHRGQGIGKILMNAVEQEAKQRGLKRILLNSGNRAERYPAHAFYLSQGFESYSIGFTKYLP